MTTNKRRRLLKAIAAGGGAVIAGRSLPETWSRPVVDSLALPAHAQTSPLSCLPASVSTTANQQDTQNGHKSQQNSVSFLLFKHLTLLSRYVYMLFGYSFIQQHYYYMGIIRRI